ncbi:hypothetical protein BZJ17_02690 [Salinivibrio sp. IB574]|uniref:flagellar hook-length control protein FliK n=1 Tax=Salinivibrio sp. IB574 TaxID=1909444 RepID=UPI000988A4AF|nr:flagellar hook-length control protein FliK [Salinivibrio sp. IB574]OOF23969.1 hypothetical protein BZJ17_02690 [Salinivibrio sp. IB574]
MKIGTTNPQQLVLKPPMSIPALAQKIDASLLANAQFTLLTPGSSTPLSDTLAQLHLFPAVLNAIKNQPPATQAMMQSLLALWTLPGSKSHQPLDPETLMQWLTHRPADKPLTTLLRQWLNRNEDAGPLIGVLRLMAEQRVSESARSGEWQWVFPFAEPEKPPVRVHVKRRQSEKKAKPEKQQWQIRLYLPVGKQYVRADVNLEGKGGSLLLTAPTDALKRRIQATLPWLEERLASQHIPLDIAINPHHDSQPPEQDTRRAGLSIKV